MTHDERERDQRLLDAAAGLPRSIEPANDLWPGIEREIRENREYGRYCRDEIVDGGGGTCNARFWSYCSGWCLPPAA